MGKTNGQAELVLESGHISNLPKRGVRTSKLDDEIKQLAASMKEGEYRRLNPQIVIYSTWASAIRKLKKAGELAATFRIERHGKEYYFVNRPMADI